VEVGITFRHDLMKRTPNTFRGHVLLAAALKEELHTQNLVVERLFQAYFLNGEDVGDPATLLSIAREFGVTAISRVEDLDSPALGSEVKIGERMAASAGIRGGPKSRFKGKSLPTVLRKKSCSRTQYCGFWEPPVTVRTASARFDGQN
jgi:predicted DsbA family dithiol-disulfide isomerase